MAIISELCGNWDGSKDLLFDMVTESAKAGASFVKIQTFYAKDLAPAWQDSYDRIKKLELTEDDHRRFVEHCNVYKITPMTTIYSPEYLSMLGQVGFRWIKIGSPQVTDTNLIRLITGLGFKVIVSTGGHLVHSLPAYLNVQGVLHCVSKYPHKSNESNLMRMVELKGRYPNCSIGWSDHSDPTTSDWATPSIQAMALGAKFIEKHFTLIDRKDTKDGCVSITTNQLAYLCSIDRMSLHDKRQLLSPELRPLSSEQSKEEIELITKYKGRWNEFDYTVSEDTEESESTEGTV